MVAMWALVGVGFELELSGGPLEQFIWAHSVQWGYYKHPPLPTWLLAAAIELFGPSVESARTLAVICVFGTGLFTYLVARELFDRPTAALSLLFWGLQAPVFPALLSVQSQHGTDAHHQRCRLVRHSRVARTSLGSLVAGRWRSDRAVSVIQVPGHRAVGRRSACRVVER